jgi:hypothetical protein
VWSPGLREAVLRCGEEPATRRVLGGGTRVEGEGTELSVERGEGGGWSRMFYRSRRKEGLLRAAANCSCGLLRLTA